MTRRAAMLMASVRIWYITANLQPDDRAAAIIASAAETVTAMGFSDNAWMPRWKAATAIGGWK